MNRFGTIATYLTTILAVGSAGAAQIELLRDVRPGTGASFPRDFVTMGSSAYFIANGDLWKTDGTTPRTQLASDNPTSANDLVATLNRLYFTSSSVLRGRELWVSDGTDAGTRLARDIRTGRVGSAVQELTQVGSTNRVVFTADDGSHGREVWVSDGTVIGTRLVKELVVGRGSASPDRLVRFGRKILFTALSNGRRQAFVTDGTRAGTNLFQSTPGNVSSIGVHGSSAYIATRSPSELYLSTPSKPLTRLRGVTAGTEFVRVGSRTLFSAHTASNGFELWCTDDTPSTTRLLKSINPGSASSGPRDFTVVGRTVYFTAFTSSHGRELWKTDGSAAGTVLVKDVRPGSSSSFDLVPELTEARGLLFFRATSDGTSPALWVSYGTSNSTFRVPLGARPSRSHADLHSHGTKLLLSASSTFIGREPWVVEPETLFGTYETFGSGCIGTGRHTSKCITVVGNGFDGSVVPVRRTFALEFPRFLFPRHVVGFEFPTRSIRAAGITTTGSIHFEDATGIPAPSPVASGSVVIDNNVVERNYRVLFDSPVIVPANTKFFLTVDADHVRVPFTRGGDLKTTYVRNDPNPQWLRHQDRRWSMRVLCRSLIPVIPKLTGRGGGIGRKIFVNLTGGARGSAALLHVGLSDTSWGGLPLPFNMAPFGAPLCSIFAAGDLRVPGIVDNLGELSIEVPIPNDENLIGLRIFNQYAVFDAGANAMGVAMSNAGVTRIGR